MDHGMKYITLYVKKTYNTFINRYSLPLVRYKPLGAPTPPRLVYFMRFMVSYWCSSYICGARLFENLRSQRYMASPGPNELTGWCNFQVGMCACEGGREGGGGGGGWTFGTVKPLI